MAPTEKTLDYASYLKIDEVLQCQVPQSRLKGREAHDEMLFIIVHQVYELWFRQILHELNSIHHLFKKPQVTDEGMGSCVARLERITKIQKILMDQVAILETMTPMDFLDFRDLLYPASGFQSFQFRMIENRLGLKSDHRVKIDQNSYLNRLDEKHRETVRSIEKDASLFDLVEDWLERTPFVQMNDFSFWQSYRESVDKMLSEDEASIRSNPFLNESSRSHELEQLKKTRASFEIVHNEELMNEAIKEQRWRLSHKATLAALFIHLYREEPALQMPFKVLSLFSEIDESFTAWRSRHAQLALRMLGSKIGTGGSSGAEYLQRAANSHRIFFDITRLATFLIPRGRLPRLPKDVKMKLAFRYSELT